MNIEKPKTNEVKTMPVEFSDVSGVDFSRFFADQERKIVATRKARTLLRAECAQMGGFCPMDLGQWVGLARSAGVPMIPSVVIASGKTDVWNEESNDLGVISQAESVARHLSKGKYMLRWSWSSHGEVKQHINSGTRDWVPELAQLYKEDDRSYELQMDYPLPDFAVYMRPWIDLKPRKAPSQTPAETVEQREQENGYRDQSGRPRLDIPLRTYDAYAYEVRVFVENGKIAGISNYYPQCPSSEADAKMVRLMDEAETMTSHLIAHQNKVLVMPKDQIAHGKPVNNWTADFVMTSDGQVLFLEGGPAHYPRGGAHPCCFEPGKISGRAFAPIEGA